MDFKKLVFLSILFVLGLTLSAQASILGNGPPDQGGAQDLNGYLEADSFTMDANTAISQVQFWALQGPSGYSGSIYWAIYSNAAGAPGSAVASGTAAATGTATGNNVYGFDEYSYVFNANATLSSLTTYWLVLHNGDPSTAPGGDFFWETSNWMAGNSQNAGIGSPNDWVSNFNSLAFEITANSAPTPEPATLSLLAVGLAAGWLKRKTPRS